ncbi:ATP-binding protein [Hymenobacter sp. 5516J-16]|uniref:sensor histidine kinase n=1 Tax=Hymenobacter sp. 5516J-16 TaxID=2932253 RepID=UPI001FD5E9F5|nr:ATP-binding protein [Hymenobacter sp. 5516J-16]UOQ76077.1 ATP-binding protein [Hymenobacter sp. 5516J-16]
MRLKLNTKIVLGFIIAVGVLLLTSAASWYCIQQLAYYTQRVEHTYQVLQGTANMRSNIRDAQSHIRSYLLLNDTAALTSFRRTLPEIHTNFELLRQLTLDNLNQQSRLDTLELATENEIAYLTTWTKRLPGTAAVRELILGDRDRQLQVRALLERVRQEEETLLLERRRRQDFFETTTPAAIVVSAVLAAIIVLWLFTKITREVRANEELQRELAYNNEQVAHRIRIIESLANKVVQGDYTVKISDQEQDSLGNLATALNHMTQTLDTSFTALENRNRELDQFAYVASHDLKAPLRGVVTVVKWIEDELSQELSPQMRQYLEMIKGRLNRLEDLINGLLAYARAGRTEQKLEEVSVGQLVQDITELVVPPTFRVETPTPLPTFVTDRLSLQQVFTNLMGNAAKYHHRPDGLLRISCRDLGECYEFRVQDDGPGIAPQFHQKVFLMFQTLRDRNSAESTGIGLSIVKRIVEEKKGTIHIESEEGKGAAFIFTWPK